MYRNPKRYASMPLGVVLRRAPGVTRWAKWSWKATAVLPGAGPADWREIRRDGDSVEFHAATLTLELHGAECEAYAHGLSETPPSVYAVMRNDPAGEDGRLSVVLVTASPYEAQDYCDSGEEIVEKIPMTDGLAAWVADFVSQHYAAETFRKRRRDKARIDADEDGIGDARIPQITDVYRAPTLSKKARGS